MDYGSQPTSDNPIAGLVKGNGAVSNLNVVELMTRINAILDWIPAQLSKKILSSRGSDAQRLLDSFQQVLDIDYDLLSSVKKRLIPAIQDLSATSGLFPRCYDLHGPTSSDLPEATRSSTDIYKAFFAGQLVCIKTARFREPKESEHFLKVVSKEALFWGQLRHLNVLPFYGVYRYNDMISFVTPWMDNGNIQSYLQHHTDTNRRPLVSDVARGLKFLHENDIVHGDLKGPNVLMSSSGRACITDFGLASVSDQKVLSWASLSSYASKGGSVRWQAPELFDPNIDEEMCCTTKASDMYAFGSVAYEIFAGHSPFAHLIQDTAVMEKILNGERPQKPPNPGPSWTVWGLTEDIWALIDSYWDADPFKRPELDAFIVQLNDPLPDNAAIDDLLSPIEFRVKTRGPINENEIEICLRMLENFLTSSRR